MQVRRHLTRVAALSLVLSMPLLGLAGVASAKATKAVAKACAKHPNKAKCTRSSGGGSGSGGPPVQITVEVDPNPLVETGQSEIHAVVQVETLPSFAGDQVNIDSSQLTASCSVVTFGSVAVASSHLLVPLRFRDRIDAVLDDDGNATVVIDGGDCAPGTSVVEADLEVAPFLTALTTLVANPPVVTPEGVTGYPQSAGVAQEVETGDTSTSGDSDIYAVFYVETNPVYAEQLVEIGSAQLESRCVLAWNWNAGNQGGVGVGTASHDISGVGVNEIQHASTYLDDDGNAVFVFFGQSCASGTSQVVADVEAGTHPTYTTTFTVDPPAPTI